MGGSDTQRDLHGGGVLRQNLAAQEQVRDSIMSDAEPGGDLGMQVDPLDSPLESDDNEGLMDGRDAHQIQLERSRYAQCGVIKRIKLINFMCHEHLVVNLSPHVNFIHGENGSGKSAILVAISTCLGVKASDTNRGSSLKELIKQGQEWSQVELTLSNGGQDAFQPEPQHPILQSISIIESSCQKFGNAITIRREITHTSSSYKIFSERDTVVGRTKKDLQAILDHFNIQVENPCVVMNQDTTKEFLLSNKNSAKYDFFLKATQLEQMGKLIDSITSDYKRTGQYLDAAQKQVDLLDVNRRDKEHLYNCTQDLAIIDQQIDRLRDQCLWAGVHEINDAIDNKQSEAVQFGDKLRELDEQLDFLMVEKEAADRALDECKQRLIAERNAINNDVRVRQTLEHALQSAKKALVRFQTHLAQYDKNEQAALKRRADLQEQLQQLEAQRSRDRDQEDQERIDQIHKLKHRAMEHSALLEEAQRESAGTRRELEQCRDAVTQNTELLQRHRARKSGIEQQLAQVQRAAADQLNRFGGDMSSLVRRIQAESRMFHVQPAGPIGVHVAVKNRNYSAAAQKAIGKKILCGFLVDSFADQKALSSLFQSFYKNPREIPFIIVLKKPAYRYEVIGRNPAYGEHPRVVDVVDIADPWCYNAIIDKAQIDCILLMPSANDAHRLLRDLEQRREFTPVVFTPQLDRITLNKGSLNNTSNPFPDRQGSILDSVTQTDLDELQSTMREAEAQIRSVQAEGDELKQRAQRASDASRHSNRKVQALSSDMDAIKAEIVTRERQAVFDDDHVGGLIVDLHDKVAKCDALIDDAKHDQAVCQANLSEAQDEYARRVAEVDEFNENASRAGAGLEQATEQVNAALNDVARVQVKIGKIGPLRCKMEMKISEIGREIDALKDQVMGVRQEAEAQTGGRVLNVDRSSTEIMEEMNQMQKKREEDREAISSESVEQITADYVKARDDFNSAELKMAECERDFLRIQKKLRSSSKDWEIFKRRLSKQASYDFHYNMSQKGHEGHIQFDHSKGTLHMFVKMQHHEGQGEMTSDTKALSGGERSFTTLAFVIAVGESIRTPFRALDEFDIFMDSVNRKIAINLLMELSKKYRNRQFIFITPQDVSMIKTSPTTFVLMLKPPVRPTN